MYVKKVFQNRMNGGTQFARIKMVQIVTIAIKFWDLNGEKNE